MYWEITRIQKWKRIGSGNPSYAMHAYRQTCISATFRAWRSTKSRDKIGRQWIPQDIYVSRYPFCTSGRRNKPSNWHATSDVGRDVRIFWDLPMVNAIRMLLPLILVNNIISEYTHVYMFCVFLFIYFDNWYFFL